MEGGGRGMGGCGVEEQRFTHLFIWLCSCETEIEEYGGSL